VPAPYEKHHPARKMSPSMEQYVETIWDLLQDAKVCTVSDIAERAGVSRPAASRAIRDLAEKGLVEHESYRFVDLTEAGHALGDKLEARHRTLETFFRDVLRLDPEEADEEACRLEHQIDDDMVARLADLTAFMADGPVQHKWDETARGFKPRTRR